MKKTLWPILIVLFFLSVGHQGFAAELQKSFPYAPRTPGTAGQVWKSNGAASVPTWQAGTATPAGADGGYQVNTGGVLAAGSIKESGGSIFCVSTAGGVIWADYSATGEHARFYPSGQTLSVTSTARGTLFFQSGNTRHEWDASGDTTYATDGTTVRYGTYAANLVGGTLTLSDHALDKRTVNLDAGGISGASLATTLNVYDVAANKMRSGVSNTVAEAAASNDLVATVGAGVSIAPQALNTEIVYSANNTGTPDTLILPAPSGTSIWAVNINLQGSSGGIFIESGARTDNILFYGHRSGTLVHNGGKASGVTAIYVAPNQKFVQVYLEGVSGETDYIYWCTNGADAITSVSPFEGG